MTNHPKILLITLFFGAFMLLLGGCSALRHQPSSVKAYFGSENATLTVNRTISYPTTKTRVFFQEGETGKTIDHNKNQCNLEVFTRDDENIQTVKPGVFRVTAVSNIEEIVVENDQSRAVQLAALDKPLLLAADFSDGPADIYLGIYFYLQGEDPNVYRLSCYGAYAAPHEAERPTLSEIRHALGEWISI